MGLWDRFRAGLSRTARHVVERFDEIARRADDPARRALPLDADTVDDLEELLITADVGVAAARRIVAAVQTRRREAESLRTLIKDEIHRILNGASEASGGGGRPRVVLVVGVNGTGKTTTAGKLAWHYKGRGLRPLLCAADTFRAAATQQLDVWAARAGVEMVRARPGADPAAVVFDAIAAGRARGYDLIVIDTAGRLHTRANLMGELAKMCRVAAREVKGAPHEVLLVLDATVGQNGLIQAREFMETAGVTGVVLAKLDGTAKGGIAVAIANDLRLPIRYVGVGEQMDDLVPFSPQKYVDALFDAGP